MFLAVSLLFCLFLIVEFIPLDAAQHKLLVCTQSPHTALGDDHICTVTDDDTAGNLQLLGILGDLEAVSAVREVVDAVGGALN